MEAEQTKIDDVSNINDNKDLTKTTFGRIIIINY